mgnify:CR=1 FL=1
MAAQAQGGSGLYGTEHGHLTERTGHGTEHSHGRMDISEPKRTFDGFIKFWIYLFAVVAAVLIFLAIFVA